MAKKLRSERAQARARKQRNQRIGLGLILLLLISAIVFFTVVQPRLSTDNGAEMVKPASVTVSDAPVITTASGLQIQDIKVGEGAAAKNGDQVVVHYTGWLTDGTEFDSSYNRVQPFSFTLGSGGVIKGWDEGVVGMQPGGKRVLIIPAELGYGDRGSGSVILPGADLVFEIDLVEIK